MRYRPRITYKARGCVIRWSANATREWARRWPCSTLAGRRVTVELYKGDLVDVLIDGGRTSLDDIDGHELSALIESA